MRRFHTAFTLVELLMVIGIMGMLATVSVGGYAALTRGMAERGALDAAASLAEAALQRAQVDRTRTYVFTFDEVLRAETDDEAGVACGVLVAVRPIGRVTHAGNYIADEFGDLNQGFGSLDTNANGSPSGNKEVRAGMMRLYNLTTKQWATVQSGVFFEQGLDETDLEDGERRQMGRHGFKHLNGASFSVGDLYGQEFAVTRLPPGFIFGSSIAMNSSSDLGLKQIGSAIEVRPDDGSAPNLQVYRIQPDGQPKSIGSTSQAKDINRR